jgi:hypothetical protein
MVFEINDVSMRRIESCALQMSDSVAFTDDLGGETSYHPDCSGRMHSNRCASATHEFGRFLTYPASVFLADGVRTFARPLTPGRAGQYRSAPLEIVARALRTIKLLILLPFVLSFGLIGGLLRTCVNNSGALYSMAFLSPDRAAVLPHSAADTTTQRSITIGSDPASPITVRMCTYNVRARAAFRPVRFVPLNAKAFFFCVSTLLRPFSAAGMHCDALWYRLVVCLNS